MKKSVFAAALIFILGLLLGGDFLFAEGSSRVGLIPLINQTNDGDQEMVKETIDSTLATSFQFLEEYQVEPVSGLNPYDNLQDALRFLISRNLDYTVFGRIYYDAGRIPQVEISIYDLVEKREMVTLTRALDNLFEIFTIADEMVGEVINSFSTIHIGFGNLKLINEGEPGLYTVLLDGKALGERLEEVRSLPMGEHHLTIEQERIFGTHLLVDETVTIPEGETREVSFAIPLLTGEEEKALLLEETFIKKHWYKPESRQELAASFRRLEEMLADPDYAPALMRRQVKYILWEEIYNDGGEIPGVTKPPRPAFHHTFFSVEGGGALMAGATADLFTTGADVRLTGGRTWVYRAFDWSLFAQGGMKQADTLSSVVMPYTLSTVPLALGSSLRTGFKKPYFAEVRLYAGASVQNLQYKASVGEEDRFGVTPYLGGGLGVGYFLNTGSALRLFVDADVSLFKTFSPLEVILGGGFSFFL